MYQKYLFSIGQGQMNGSKMIVIFYQQNFYYLKPILIFDISERSNKNWN